MDGPSDSEIVVLALAAMAVALLFLPAAVAVFYAVQDLLGWPRWDRDKPERRGFEPVIHDRPPDEP
jgi:hypothetical protein